MKMELNCETEDDFNLKQKTGIIGQYIKERERVKK